MKKRLSGVFLILILLSLLLSSACQSGSPQANTVTDDFGRQVSIAKSPERIISLAPSNTELVYALGLEDRLIGVTTYCNYPPQVEDKPRVADFSRVDIEKIVSLQPDLVLAGNIHKDEIIPALEKVNVTVLGIDPERLDKILATLKMLGSFTDSAAEADTLIASLTTRIKAVTDKTEKLSTFERPRVFFLTWHDPLWTVGRDTLVFDLIEKAGGENIASDLSGHAQIDLESVIQRNPQVILVLTSMGSQSTSFEFIKSEPRFQATDALKSGRIFQVDTDIFGRTTPRAVDGLEEMTRMIHPEIFK
ncbi:MAG: cobalamin-binding protein [Dehalococcoidales bacterium]|nr:cobalamin-binding protein [Dehalococcoidales bacterium]